METMNSKGLIFNGDCVTILKELMKDYKHSITTTFLDPPFNQAKYYPNHNDSLPEEEYWSWMKEICKLVYTLTEEGGTIYFMQREKNTFQVWKTLEESGWKIQNLIIWKKLTSAVPQKYRYGKHYQIIAFAAKGEMPSTFNKVRINLPIYPHQKIPRKQGIYPTDVWDDIKELTSGYFAGDEAIRNKNGSRTHIQQSPISLLTRIILSSTKVGDLILDPFAGTGTSGVVAKQLKRRFILIELAEEYCDLIRKRITETRLEDNIDKLREYYRDTDVLDTIWPITNQLAKEKKEKSIESFFEDKHDKK